MSPQAMELAGSSAADLGGLTAAEGLGEGVAVALRAGCADGDALIDTLSGDSVGVIGGRTGRVC